MTASSLTIESTANPEVIGREYSASDGDLLKIEVLPAGLKDET